MGKEAVKISPATEMSRYGYIKYKGGKRYPHGDFYREKDLSP